MGNRNNREVVNPKSVNNTVTRTPIEGDIVYARYMGIALIVEVSNSNKGLVYCKFYHPHSAEMEGCYSYGEMGLVIRYLDEFVQ